MIPPAAHGTGAEVHVTAASPDRAGKGIRVLFRHFTENAADDTNRSESERSPHKLSSSFELGYGLYVSLHEQVPSPREG